MRKLLVLALLAGSAAAQEPSLAAAPPPARLDLRDPPPLYAPWYAVGGSAYTSFAMLAVSQTPQILPSKRGRDALLWTGLSLGTCALAAGTTLLILGK